LSAPKVFSTHHTMSIRDTLTAINYRRGFHRPVATR
jgi:hypothetical protein